MVKIAKNIFINLRNQKTLFQQTTNKIEQFKKKTANKRNCSIFSSLKEAFVKIQIITKGRIEITMK